MRSICVSPRYSYIALKRLQEYMFILLTLLATQCNNSGFNMFYHLSHLSNMQNTFNFILLCSKKVLTIELRISHLTWKLGSMTHQAKYHDRAPKVYEPACSLKCVQVEEIWFWNLIPHCKPALAFHPQQSCCLWLEIKAFTSSINRLRIVILSSTGKREWVQKERSWK